VSLEVIEHPHTSCYFRGSCRCFPCFRPAEAVDGSPKSLNTMKRYSSILVILRWRLR